MIKEFEYYHGSVISAIIHATTENIQIKSFTENNNSSYVLFDKVGLYIKHSTKRMSPWRFTFLKDHQDEIDLMKVTLQDIFVLLVCNDDGIVCINFKELKKLLDEIHEEAEWISVTRKVGGMYSVKGKNGKLEYKVGRNDFPKKIFELVLPK